VIRPPPLLMQQVKHTPEGVERIYQLAISGDELRRIHLPRLYEKWSSDGISLL
jgi:hypothetical protein